jgi:hypothetical protein
MGSYEPNLWGKLMNQSFTTLPLIITVILFLLISTVIVYYCDVTGNPIWDKPALIPAVIIIPLILVGWLPLGFYALSLYKQERPFPATLLSVITVLWIIAIIVAMGGIIRFLIGMSNKFLGF